MDLYEVLQLSDKASPDDIKKAYQHLILQHHPDKAGNLDTFLKIDQAYKVLKDPSSRKEYDSRRFQASRSQMIVHDTVERSEFLFDEANDVRYHVCKCGGWYILDEESDEEDYIICCDECSLVIKVINNKNS